MEASNFPPGTTPPEQQSAGQPEQPPTPSAPVSQGGPSVPTVEHTPQTPEEVRQLSDAFAEYRKEVADLRRDIAAGRRPAPQVAAVETEADRRKAREEAIDGASHYCPGCGRLSTYMRECAGTPTAPHQPIDMVSTDELSGDSEKFTAAPATDEAAFA